MSTRVEKERAKQIQDKCQNLLSQMLRDEDNKYCVDCDAKGPRWASWNLGIFLCIRCAGIHRNLGVHISKVKSVTLDSWTPEQVVSLQQMGNSRARAVYEANLPDSFRRPQTDCSLESFIRAKYEHKKYIAREWVPPTLPKVNWDKELDEEAEKQRKKKKETQKAVIQNPLPPVKKPEVVPQLPKPISSVSPKPKLTQNTATLDLLGLDAPENLASSNGSSANDDFTKFLSAPPISSNEEKNKSKDINSSDSDKTEEENFFNQPATTLQDKNKMTKDSILALYGQSNQTAFGGSTMFSQPAHQYSQTLTNTMPFNMMNSVQTQMGLSVNNQFSNPNQMNLTNRNVASTFINTTVPMPPQMHVSNPQMGINPNNGWSSMLTTNLHPSPGSNPFLNLSSQQPQDFSQLPQQLSDMSLGNMNFTDPTPKSTTGITGHTLSTNLWQ